MIILKVAHFNIALSLNQEPSKEVLCEILGADYQSKWRDIDKAQRPIKGVPWSGQSEGICSTIIFQLFAFSLLYLAKVYRSVIRLNKNPPNICQSSLFFPRSSLCFIARSPHISATVDLQWSPIIVLSAFCPSYGQPCELKCDEYFWVNTWPNQLLKMLSPTVKEVGNHSIFLGLWVMTTAQVFGHGMIHYNSIQIEPVPDCFWQCHSEVSFYYNDDDSYQIYICLFICRFLASPQLTSCSTHVSERKTHKKPQSGREVCWVVLRRMRVHFLLRPWTMSIGSGIPWRSWWLIPRSGLLRADDLWVLLEGSTRNAERPDVKSSDEVFEDKTWKLSKIDTS